MIMAEWRKPVQSTGDRPFAKGHPVRTLGCGVAILALAALLVSFEQDDPDWEAAISISRAIQSF
jgi:hypothetical protein